MASPNFIVIHTDQHRYDCIIESIAYQGINFTSAYAACPLCIPQRLSWQPIFL